MNKTSIEWVKNPDGSQGYTWNPITGCLNGCSYCYARRLANGRLKPLYLANTNFVYTDSGNLKHLVDPFYPRFWSERLMDSDFWTKGKRDITKPKGIFVCDISDLFGIGIPEEWTRKVLRLIRINPQHRFYLLTKQPGNMLDMLGGSIKPFNKASKLPSNCWAGVTITGKWSAPLARDFLQERVATINYLSIEPFLDYMDGWALSNVIRLADWLIIGACTGTLEEIKQLVYKYPQLTPMPLDKNMRRWTAQPKIEWVKEMVEAADNAGTPIFLKDNLSPIAGDPRHNFNLYNHFEPMNPVLRQEMPK